MFLVTLPDTLQGRGSLASRVRGWKDDATGLEQRLKDLETIARSLRRRWWLVGLGLPLGIIGWGFGAVRTRPGTMVLLGGGGLVLNALLGIINERGWYRWWLIYVLALDRKSTRLNSSHVSISYAVFCLKKKKTDHV